MNNRKIAIIGTGMIASGLAVLCTGHGYQTTVYSRSGASEGRCRQFYDKAFEQLAAQGLMTREQADICRTYLFFTEDYSALGEAELVFECIVEDLGKKHEVYRQLEAHCGHLKAVCSASSSIVPNALAEGMGRLEDRILVAHPFHPAHMVPYIEICVSDRTKRETLDYVCQVLGELDRKPVILKKPTPGFIGNRLQFALLREAIELVESGIADPRDIDACLAYSFCPRYTSIGIFEHFDNGGLELCSTVCRNLFPILGNGKEVPGMLQELVEAGNLGAKTGRGFYEWEGVDPDAYEKRVNAPYWRFCSWKYPGGREGEHGSE